MTHMNIPDKAVEAVAESMFHATTPGYWSNQSVTTQRRWWIYAHTALKAAHPFMKDGEA